MSSRLEAFREFISRHSSLRKEVLSGKKTWQNIYEDWVILGEENEIWNSYRNGNINTNTNNYSNSHNNNTNNIDPNKTTLNDLKNMKLEDLLSGDNLKNIWGYIKKINPDNLSKTLNTVQKVLQITQSFGRSPTSGLYNANYNSWWD